MAARPRRLPHVSYVGRRRYFLTFCVSHRSRVFADADVVALVLSQFSKTAAEYGFAVLAYCFMPDHVHLLVAGITDASDLQRFVKMAKQRAGGVYARRHGRALWQEGYFERVLRENDDGLECARYIVDNPVRAGLVTSPEDYPFLGSEVWPLSVLMEGLQ